MVVNAEVGECQMSGSIYFVCFNSINTAHTVGSSQDDTTFGRRRIAVAVETIVQQTILAGKDIHILCGVVVGGFYSKDPLVGSEPDILFMVFPDRVDYIVAVEAE